MPADTIPGTTTSNVAYYQTLAAYIHTGHGNNNEVVLNFGPNPGSDWMFNASAKKDADLIVTFEGSYDTPGMNPYTEWVQPAWELQYPASNFAAISPHRTEHDRDAATELSVRRTHPPTRRIRRRRDHLRPDALPRRHLLTLARAREPR